LGYLLCLHCNKKVQYCNRADIERINHLRECIL
jgi:hypothetical protein